MREYLPTAIQRQYMSLSTHFRDPVHGFIELEPHEVRLVDTPCFQRLRRIRQLAMADLAFHGAVHTRFDHSLGTCHVAGRVAAQLELDPAQRRLVRLAALLHDVGHGPFSHVFDDILEAVWEEEGRDVRSEKPHELISRTILGRDRGISDILSATERQQLASLLDRGYGDPLLKDIVSGSLDADKMDYLLRDSYFCGVRYGVYDLDQLLLSFAQ